jgi:hypothetical protein
VPLKNLFSKSKPESLANAIAERALEKVSRLQSFKVLKLPVASATLKP